MSLKARTKKAKARRFNFMATLRWLFRFVWR